MVIICVMAFLCSTILSLDFIEVIYKLVVGKNVHSFSFMSFLLNKASEYVELFSCRFLSPVCSKSTQVYKDFFMIPVTRITCLKLNCLYFKVSEAFGLRPRVW